MPSILIVDDEPAIANLLENLLSGEGFNTETAADSTQAIAACSRKFFDLVLSDISMPGMNGHQLTRWVAANYPATRTALMTGFDDTGEQFPRSTGCQIIEKPFTPKRLVSFVRSIVGHDVPPMSRFEPEKF